MREFDWSILNGNLMKPYIETLQFFLILIFDFTLMCGINIDYPKLVKLEKMYIKQ